MISLVRGSDQLAVVNVPDNTVPASSVAKLAISKVADYPVDGAGAILIFRTSQGEYVLGGVRSNPALAREKTKLDRDFPMQINTTIGGKVMDPSLSLREAVIRSIAFKMFYLPLAEEKQDLDFLFADLAKNEGWDERVAVHTDKWGDTDADRMCFLTTIKRIDCDEAYLQNLGSILSNLMERKKAEGAAARTLTQFEFRKLQPIVDNSLATYQKKELEKAQEAYEKSPTEVLVSFNDLSVAVLANAGAFK